MPAADEKDNPGIVEKRRRFASRRSSEKGCLGTAFRRVPPATSLRSAQQLTKA
jgi:hypothetical protein